MLARLRRTQPAAKTVEVRDRVQPPSALIKYLYIVPRVDTITKVRTPAIEFFLSVFLFQKCLARQFLKKWLENFEKEKNRKEKWHFVPGGKGLQIRQDSDQIFLYSL